MSADDKMINVAVRRVLTGLWVDITLVNVSTFTGVVHITGHIQRMTATHNELFAPGLMELDRRVRAVRGVTDIRYRFDNWLRNGQGQWVKSSPDDLPGIVTTIDLDGQLPS